MADIKVMPLKGLLAESFSYMRDNGREMTLFAVVHMMFLTAAFELIDGWHDVFFCSGWRPITFSGVSFSVFILNGVLIWQR